MFRVLQAQLDHHPTPLSDESKSTTTLPRYRENLTDHVPLLQLMLRRKQQSVMLLAAHPRL